jgi:hypothetical protein
VPYGVLGEVPGDRLPHEHRRPVEAEPVVRQRLGEVVGLEVHRHQPNVGGDLAEDGPDTGSFGVDAGGRSTS